MGLIITPSTVQVQEEGTSQGAVNTINVVGQATTVTVSGNTATLTDLSPSLGLTIMLQELNYNL